jgi:FtsP/CotA-like multicopper oxidase with cupredoxin domain
MLGGKSMLNRRQFFVSTASAVALGAMRWPRLARAERNTPTILRVQKRAIEVNGKPASVFGIRQADGASGLVTAVGSRFRVQLDNQSGEPTLIHWHGLKPPHQQDGVPGISAPLIAPGATADYDFPLAYSGTFWMHSHQGLQEQNLLDAPLIIHDGNSPADEQEIVVMLHDFTFRPPTEILADLRKRAPPGSGMAMSGMTGEHSSMAGMNMGDMKMGAPKSMEGGMQMDLNDIAFDAFLTNDRTLGDPGVIRVDPGGQLLMRIINAAAASNFIVDLGSISANLVAVDGHAVNPVPGTRFPIAMAQRLDLRLTLPKGEGVYPLFAVLEGERKRTGIVLATKRGKVTRLPENAAATAPALGFDFEHRLRAAVPLAVKAADRSYAIDLTGSMENYDWGLNGVSYGNDNPLVVATGERVEITMTNRTMMSHPMHTHGHFFQVVALNDKRFAGAVRDVVLVPPMNAVTIAFDADNPGKWVFHCHNLYHMESGMMTTIQYQGI